MRILLIEPDYILSKTYTHALESEGHKVITTKGAQSAIDMADKTTPDLVILELQLIEHSGIEFIYEFRSYQEWQNIPLLVLTTVPPGEFSGSWQLLKDELKVSTYLYKPQTSLKKLIEVVKEFSVVTV